MITLKLLLHAHQSKHVNRLDWIWGCWLGGAHSWLLPFRTQAPPWNWPIFGSPNKDSNISEWKRKIFLWMNKSRKLHCQLLAADPYSKLPSSKLFRHYHVKEFSILLWQVNPAGGSVESYRSTRTKTHSPFTCHLPVELYLSGYMETQML